MKTTLKEIFESDNWIITKIMQGNKMYRVDAKRRFNKADETNFFSEWGSIPYLNRLAKENYNKKCNEFNSFTY